jgi:hypothetical protein
MSLYKGNNLISGAMPNSANKSLSNLDSDGQDKFDAKVNKSGDTMTGTLSIDRDGTNINLNNPDLTKGTNPSSTKYISILMNDGSNSSSWQAKRLGMIEHQVYSNGNSQLQISAIQNVANSQTMARLQLNMTQAGVASCSFPNTTCCDGQYVNMSPATTIVSNVSINGSSNLTYTLNLPSDGRNYMVWIMAEASTGATSGNYINVKVGSDIMTSTTVARASARTAAKADAGSTLCLVVSSSHKIYLGRATNWNGTASLYMIGYRRIGTNA